MSTGDGCVHCYGRKGVFYDAVGRVSTTQCTVSVSLVHCQLNRMTAKIKRVILRIVIPILENVDKMPKLSLSINF